jgi:Domain of unknown function (DUF4365)
VSNGLATRVTLRPQVRSTVQTERVGIAAVQKAVAEAGGFFRELPLPDEGIDAQIEWADDEGRPNGRLVAVQVKSGSSYFNSATEDGWRYSLKKSNLEYWGKYALPVILVLYDPDSDRAYWQVVRAENLSRTVAGGVTIFMPKEQVLDASALPALERIANEGLPQEPAALALALSERRAEADVGWMELLAAGDRLFLEAEEWVNKTSGRGTLRLVVEDDRGRTEREWPWVFLPGASYAEELPKLFPWADLAVDRQRFREEAYPEFLNECAVWDSEDADYIVMEDFDEWIDRRLAAGLQPYAETANGEVALWRLELKLNDLGRETLAREHEADWWRALLEMDREDAEREAVANGCYEGQYGDAPIARTVERVLFFWGDDADVVVADEVLWTDEEARFELARGVRQHALQREPSRALTDAFVARYRDVLDDDGKGWVIEFSDLQRWLSELGVRG